MDMKIPRKILVGSNVKFQKSYARNVSYSKMSFISNIIDSFLEWLKSLFWKQEMELTLIGLQNSGKTTIVNVVATGQFNEDMIPTVGFNMKKVTKGNVSIKLWDIGGQPRFRSMWERYCRGVNAIVFVVDSADNEKFDSARKELQELITKPQLQSIPLLVLGNKNDLAEAVSAEEMIKIMGLDDIQGRDVCCYSISAKNNVNIDKVLEWLISHAPKK